MGAGYSCTLLLEGRANGSCPEGPAPQGRPGPAERSRALPQGALLWAKLGLKRLQDRVFRLPVSNISVDKYKQIVYVEFSHLGASLNPGPIALQMRWVVSGKLSCVLQCHLHSRLLCGVATLCISCNFLGAHVLLTSLEKWLLPQNNPISVIILTFK